MGVLGGSKCFPEEERLAEEVGCELARRGAVLVCGGLGGIMEAASQGARRAGGLTIGILPGDRAEEANPGVEVPIVSGMGEARNVLIVKSCQAVIAIGGEFGTLSEIAFALREGVPVIGLKTWQFWKEGHRTDPIVRVQNASEAVEKALALAEGMGETRLRLKIYGINGKSAKLEALANTGATFTKIPESVIARLGLGIEGEVQIEISDGSQITRRLCSARLEIEGVSRTVPIVIGGEEERILIGYTTLEIIGFGVNSVTGKLERTLAKE